MIAVHVDGPGDERRRPRGRRPATTGGSSAPSRRSGSSRCGWWANTGPAQPDTSLLNSRILIPTRRRACIRWAMPAPRPSPSPVTTHTDRSGRTTFAGRDGRGTAADGVEAVGVQVIRQALEQPMPRQIRPSRVEGPVGSRCLRYASTAKSPHPDTSGLPGRYQNRSRSA